MCVAISGKRLPLIHALDILVDPLVYWLPHILFSLSPGSQRAVVSMSRETEANITRILKDVRRESDSDQQYQQQSTSNPSPSIWWGSQGACGVGQPRKQEATDFASLSSSSYSRQPDLVQVYMYMYLCGRMRGTISITCACTHTWCNNCS